MKDYSLNTLNSWATLYPATEESGIATPQYTGEKIPIRVGELENLLARGRDVHTTTIYDEQVVNVVTPYPAKVGCRVRYVDTIYRVNAIKKYSSVLWVMVLHNANDTDPEKVTI